jgi:hypothetical protein
MSFEMEYVLDPQIWTQINLIASFALILGLYFAILVLYRLWLSPIAKFPGPRVAAITGWYETYFDVVKKGRFLYEIEKMHAKYGESSRLMSGKVYLTRKCRSYREDQPMGTLHQRSRILLRTVRRWKHSTEREMETSSYRPRIRKQVLSIS